MCCTCLHDATINEKNIQKWVCEITFYLPITFFINPNSWGDGLEITFTYASLSWKGKDSWTISSHDWHINCFGHSIHRIHTLPSKQMLQTSGEGRPSQLRTASISCFLTLSQLEVKLNIRVSQFLEDEIWNVERTSSHFASAASMSFSMKQKNDIILVTMCINRYIHCNKRSKLSIDNYDLLTKFSTPSFSMPITVISPTFFVPKIEI